MVIDDLFGRRCDGHEAGGALPIQAHAAGGHRQAGGQGRLPGDIGPGRTLLQGGTHDHVLDLGRIDTRPGHGMTDGVAAQLLRLGVVEGSAIGAADGRAGGGDDDGFAGHSACFLGWGTGACDAVARCPGARWNEP